MIKVRFRLLLVWIGLSFIASNTRAEVDCSRLLSQLDARLASLFSDTGESFLCGPVCTFNLLQEMTQKVSPHPAAEMSKLVHQLAPQVGVSPDEFRNEGIDPDKLAPLANLYFKDQGIAKRVNRRSWNHQKFTPDLKTILKTQRALILYRFWTEPPSKIQPQTTETGSHYVLLSKHLGGNRYELKDPKTETQIRYAQFERVGIGPKKVPIYRILFEDNPNSAKTVLLTDLLTVSR